MKQPKPKLPPDPEAVNDKRAGWAEEALQSFMAATHQNDKAEALGDLMCNLAHLADRMGWLRTEDNSAGEVLFARSLRCYREEIGEGRETQLSPRLLALRKRVLAANAQADLAAGDSISSEAVKANSPASRRSRRSPGL